MRFTIKLKVQRNRKNKVIPKTKKNKGNVQEVEINKKIINLKGQSIFQKWKTFLSKEKRPMKEHTRKKCKKKIKN
jgi:hypothetical protein